MLNHTHESIIVKTFVIPVLHNISPNLIVISFTVNLVRRLSVISGGSREGLSGLQPKAHGSASSKRVGTIAEVFLFEIILITIKIADHHFTSLHFTSLHFTSLHFTSLHFTSLHFTSLHFTSLHFTSLHFTSLHFTSLHFTSLHRHCKLC